MVARIRKWSAGRFIVLGLLAGLTVPLALSACTCCDDGFTDVDGQCVLIVE
jgi:hypothetical protein